MLVDIATKSIRPSEPVVLLCNFLPKTPGAIFSVTDQGWYIVVTAIGSVGCQRPQGNHNVIILSQGNGLFTGGCSNLYSTGLLYGMTWLEINIGYRMAETYIHVIGLQPLLYRPYN